MHRVDVDEDHELVEEEEEVGVRREEPLRPWDREGPGGESAVEPDVGGVEGGVPGAGREGRSEAEGQVPLVPPPSPVGPDCRVESEQRERPPVS